MELKGSRIHTIPHAGGSWPIGKDMSEVSAAGSALDFDPHHPVTGIACFGNLAFVEGFEKARPS